ncbi:MAG: sigma-70 family RNA polymerase sigma factor [Planctomycetes bacterium]|nr:sigma-70 family RNA polymerase sigma factor [Planctomycetota bacterium]
MREAVPSDEKLVAQVREGDAEAFGRLVRKHQDYVYNAVYHMVGDDQDAEDLAQEVFVRAYNGLAGFEARARFTTWLYGILLNTVRSYWRRQARRSVVSLGFDGDEPNEPGAQLPAEDAGPLEAALQNEEIRMVRRAIGELEDELREIIVLRDMQGLPYDELAEALRIPAGTVKSRLHRARGRLKEKLEDFFDQK